MILAIETATPICSVALSMDDQTISEKRIEGQGVHSEFTFTYIQELLEKHQLSVDDLQLVLYSNGPGSYTGLRIGAAAIKGLLFGRDTPLYTLSTLTSFAAPFLHDRAKSIHAVIDARREHFYHQKSELNQSGALIQSAPSVKEIVLLEKEIQSGDVVTGTGWERMDLEKLENVNWVGEEGISAKNLIYAWRNAKLNTLFVRQNIEQFEPEYLTISQVNNSSF